MRIVEAAIAGCVSETTVRPKPVAKTNPRARTRKNFFMTVPPLVEFTGAGRKSSVTGITVLLFLEGHRDHGFAAKPPEKWRKPAALPYHPKRCRTHLEEWQHRRGCRTGVARFLTQGVTAGSTRQSYTRRSDAGDFPRQIFFDPR